MGPRDKRNPDPEDPDEPPPADEDEYLPDILRVILPGVFDDGDKD